MSTIPPSDSRFSLSAERAIELADRYGTPLYVIDETHFRERVRAYRDAFAAVYPDSRLVYASKANSALAILAIAAQEGCWIDVASEGELRAALAAGIPADRCVLHGNNKSVDELRFAMQVGVAQIVVDNFIEIDLIFELTQGRPQVEGTDLERLHCPDLLLRLAPGVDPITHEKISTGQADTKFGFNIANGAASRAVHVTLSLGLPLVGFHCHVGSQLLDPEAQRNGGELVARFAVDTLLRQKFWTKFINIGGGLGVRYVEGDRPTAIEEYNRLVVESIQNVLDEFEFNPTLAQEPGRALIAESGVTLYRVGVKKTVPSPSRGTRTYVSVDGGVSDNPRPALYGARYTVSHIPVGDYERMPRKRQASGDGDSPGEEAENAAVNEMLVTVSGKHCETDTLFEDIVLPRNLQEGDLLQVLSTGAYNSSMASNYNRFPRPAMVLLRPDGSEALIQRRDTWDEMFARESLPEGLQP